MKFRDLFTMKYKKNITHFHLMLALNPSPAESEYILPLQTV